MNVESSAHDWLSVLETVTVELELFYDVTEEYILLRCEGTFK